MENTKNVEVVGQIYSTKNYAKFHRLQNNRIVTNDRKNKLKSSLLRGEILCPIIVNEKFEIIDGQGRYEARKELGLPIVYVVDPKAGYEDCMRMNSTNNPWKIADYVDSYAAAGNENYKRVIIAHKKTGLSFSSILHRRWGAHYGQVVMEGGLTFTEEDLEKVVKSAAMVDEVSNALLLQKKRRTQVYIRALFRIFDVDGYDHNRMLTNCAKLRNSFAIMATSSDMLTEFSRVYNYHVSKNHLYFEDLAIDAPKQKQYGRNEDVSTLTVGGTV